MSRFIRNDRLRLRSTAVTMLLISAILTGVVPAAASARSRPDPGIDGTDSTGFPLTIVNESTQIPKSEVFVTILGTDVSGNWQFIDSEGTSRRIDYAQRRVEQHLNKNGIDYPNMSFSLAEASTVEIPDHLRGARVYLSLGSPMFFAVSPDNSGWAGPDLNNSADPNYDVLFDWYEFTYVHGRVPFGGNTTQVDMLGFPITARLEQKSSGFDRTTGIDLSRERAFAEFERYAGQEYRPAPESLRIKAPRSAEYGAAAEKMQAAIDRTWRHYNNGPFSLTRLNQTFSGRVVAGQLIFTKDHQGSFSLSKPTAQDVFACSGALANAQMSTIELELGAEFCAAFNRGVAEDTSLWYNPPAYYQSSYHNRYADVMHRISMASLAYGFPYDDINSQSSVTILNNVEAPDHLTLTIKPMNDADAPQVLRPPVSATVPYGQTVVLTSQAIGASEVKWQKAEALSPSVYTDIPGATQNSYSIVPTTYPVAPAYYRAVFSNLNGHQETSAAVITFS